MTAALRRIEPNEILTTQDGASARVERQGGVETLAVRDRAGRLLFEYDAASGRGSLSVPVGDLRLCAPRGAIELYAAEGIRASTDGEVAISGETLKVEAKESELHLGDARAFASTLHAAVDRAELGFGEVVRKAERVIEHAENLYQRIGDLYEVKAGRLRGLVAGSLWLKGEDVTVLAKNDVRIDGEHINLG